MTNSLRTVFQDLASDTSALAEFDGDAQAFLAAKGFPDLSDELVAEAIGNTADLLDAETAEHLSPYLMAASPVPLELDALDAGEGLGLLASMPTGDPLTDADQTGPDTDQVESGDDGLDDSAIDDGFGLGSDGPSSGTADQTDEERADDGGDDDGADRTFGEGFDDVLGDPLDELGDSDGLSFEDPDLDLLDLDGGDDLDGLTD